MDTAEKLEPLLAGRVRLAVLFGSSASGRARPDSDVDLAFLADGDSSLADELALQVELERVLGRTVDLVRELPAGIDLMDRFVTLIAAHVG